MRSLALVLITAALAAFALDRAHAVTDVIGFSPLRAELEHRAANDFNGKLNKTAKKQQKAITKSLKLLDKESSGLAKDAVFGKKIAKILRKSFKDEFRAANPAKIDNLPPLLDSAAGSLGRSVDSMLQRATEDLGSVKEKKVKKVERQLDRAAKSLNAAGSATKISKRFAKVAAAAKAVAKARKLIDKFSDGGGGGGAELMTASVGGNAFTSDFAQAEYASGDSSLQLFGTRTRQDGATETIFLIVRGVMGPGNYPMEVANAQATYEVGTFPQTPRMWQLIPGQGTLVVETLDLATPRIVARFDFEAMDDAPQDDDQVRSITNGQIDVSANVELKSGSGF